MHPRYFCLDTNTYSENIYCTQFGHIAQVTSFNLPLIDMTSEILSNKMKKVALLLGKSRVENGLISMTLIDLDHKICLDCFNTILRVSQLHS